MKEQTIVTTMQAEPQSILIATDNLTDAEILKKHLQDEFANVFALLGRI